MKEFWNMIQLLIAGIGGWLGYFLGGCDGLLFALLAFVVIDYITGVMCAVADKKLSSSVGFKGICRKVLIFLLVGIANILDLHIIGTGSVLRTAVIFFYINELAAYVKTQDTQITEYDDKLVRKYIEQIQVYDDKFVVCFKAKVEINVLR